MNQWDGPRTVLWHLPEWVPGYIRDWPGGFADTRARMRFVIGLADTNVKARTGGPFGAAVFRIGSGELVAPGVNLVPTQGNSAAHAEIVALSLAQRAVESFDLSVDGPMELVTSTEPCAMCLGAVPWSGVVRLVCGATAADAEAVGFDEGSKPGDWRGSLEARGIEVETGVEREAAVQVFARYQRHGGPIYNPRRG